MCVECPAGLSGNDRQIRSPPCARSSDSLVQRQATRRAVPLPPSIGQARPKAVHAGSLAAPGGALTARRPYDRARVCLRRRRRVRAEPPQLADAADAGAGANSPPSTPPPSDEPDGPLPAAREAAPARAPTAGVAASDNHRQPAADGGHSGGARSLAASQRPSSALHSRYAPRSSISAPPLFRCDRNQQAALRFLRRCDPA